MGYFEWSWGAGEHGGRSYCEVCEIKYKRKNQTTPCSTCPNQPPKLGPLSNEIIYIYSLLSPYRDGMSGCINPILLKDVLDTLQVQHDDRLIIFEALRDIIAVESKQRNKDSKGKSNDT